MDSTSSQLQVNCQPRGTINIIFFILSASACLWIQHLNSGFKKKKKKRKRRLPPPTIVTILRFQLCLHSPDPWPTGPLKMKKVQGDGMFNAWSHLPPLRPPLLSQDAACTNTLSVTGWQSPGVNDDTHWGLWAWIVESQRRSSEWI